jgi:WD domain, G-beta repeat/TIR domain
MPKISISYRRLDSEAMTGRIFDRLAAHYGKEAIFRDIDNIPPGIDFRVHINDMLRKTNVLLAVIGPGWLGLSGGGGLDRIQQDSDAVRVEIETALRRRTPLIPVLIGNTAMPGSDQLPPSLKDFAFRNAVRVDTGQDFDYHMDRLIRAIDTILSQTPKPPSSGEIKIPSGNTGSRQAATPADAPNKKDTGSRPAALLSTPSGTTGEKERVSISVPIPRVSPSALWPADRQGQMIRIAGAVALVLLVAVYGLFFRGSGGEEGRRLTLSGHTGPVSTVAFSPSGTTIAGGSSDKSVMIWDAGSGLLRQTLTGESEAIYALAYEPNGKRIVSAGKDGLIIIRDTDSGQRMMPPIGPKSNYSWEALPAVLSLAVSPDGSRLAAGYADASIRIWNESNGSLLRQLSGHGDAVTSVAYSPDGKTVISGSADGTVRTWDADSGQPLRTLKARSAQVLAVAIAPDGKRFAAAGSGDAVVIWSAANLQPLQTLSTQLSAVNALAFARDGRRFGVGGSDTGIQIWDADAGQLLHTLTGHSGSIRALTYSADGHRLASGSDDRTVGVWSAN